MKVRQILRHKWVVPVAALVLVFAIGAGAWAATSTSPNSTSGTTAPTVTGNTANIPDCGLGGLFGLGHMRGFPGNNEQAQGLREKAQTRSESVLKLVREKMSAEDQATFDKLMEQREAQQEALQKAMEDLRNTNQQLRELTDKYLAPDESISG